jgi:hypothetical protein
VTKPLVLVDSSGRSPFLDRLREWPRLPPGPSERTCILCGCVESRACPGGCAWQDLGDHGNWGVCTVCVDEKLCPVGELLILSAFCGERWRPKDRCPCPICKAAAPAKVRRGRAAR